MNCIKIENYNLKDIPNSAPVDLCKMGNHTEICFNSHRNNKATVVKLSKDKYMIASTGETKSYEKKTG
jgi:hypothetical protein